MIKHVIRHQRYSNSCIWPFKQWVYKNIKAVDHEKQVLEMINSEESSLITVRHWD